MHRGWYAGIGSRSTPEPVLQQMRRIAGVLAKLDFTLRSGGADGADLAFEMGCDEASGVKEIYLPWQHFNNNDSNLFGVSEAALSMAKAYHPAWDRLSFAAKKLQARNCYQILGKPFDPDSKSKFIVCWTPRGEVTGGTGQALRMAEDLNVTVINLYSMSAVSDLQQLLRKELA